MVQLNCSFLLKLRNQEFPQVFKEICSIYDVEEIEELHVKESLTRLKAHEDDLQFVWEMRNPHPLTEVLAGYTKERKDYLVGLRTRISSIKKSPFSEERRAASVLYLWMNKHRNYIYTVSSPIQTRLVDNLVTELNNNPKIEAALTDLALDSVFDSIKSITSLIVTLQKERDDEHKKNELKADEIKRAAYSEFIRFLKSLQTAVNLEDPELGFYADYEMKIESRIDKYRTRLASRTTRKKNAKMNEGKVELEGDNTPEDETSAQTTAARTKPHNDVDNGTDVARLGEVSQKGATKGLGQADENLA